MVDRFIDENTEGFSNRAEVVAAAIREFMRAHPTAPFAPERKK
jgi:metal-responsive CopG/Arc/MetJ family transcriptional regulator